MFNHYGKTFLECSCDDRCNTTIWAPSQTPHFVEDRAFSCYAMRQQQIDDVVNLLAAAEDPNDFETQCRIYNEVGIDSDTFTDYEVMYIEKEVARRCR